MSASKRETASGGVSFFGLLAILLIALKLMGTIDWSWWWVTAPLWAPAAVVLLILLVGFVIAAVVALVSR